MILVTLMMQALILSETSVLTRATQLNNPGDGILQHLTIKMIEIFNMLFGV
jgi:hypothetical protein